jgi:hypothetical protein
LVKLDGRTVEGQLVAKVRTALLDHVGPNPTVVQRHLIDRAAILSLRLAQCDRRIIHEEKMTILDNSQLVAWQNALTRVMVALGVHKHKRPSLATIIAEVTDVG